MNGNIAGNIEMAGNVTQALSGGYPKWLIDCREQILKKPVINTIKVFVFLLNNFFKFIVTVYRRCRLYSTQ